MCRRGHRQRQAERRGRYFLFTPGLSHAIPPCFVCPDCPSCPSGRPVLPSSTARFAMSNGLYCNALWPRWLRAADALAISSYIRRPAAVDMWRRGGAVAAVGAALAGVQPVRPCFVVSAVLKCGLNLAEMYRKSLKKIDKCTKSSDFLPLYVCRLEKVLYLCTDKTTLIMFSE